MRNKDLEKQIIDSMSAIELPSSAVLDKTKQAMAAAKPPRKLFWSKARIAISSCVILLLCLAITLPLVLNDKDANAPRTGYLKDNDLSNEQYSSIEDFSDNQGVLLFSFSSVTELFDMGNGVLVETNRYTQIGCEISFVGRDIAIIKEEVHYDVDDDYDKIIVNIAMPKYANSTFEQFEPYYNLDTRLTMDGIVVECEFIDDEKLGRACFYTAGYKYYIQISTEDAQSFNAHLKKLSSYLKIKYI